jgi:hypothetical protein
MTKHANGLGILSQQDLDFEWKLKITIVHGIQV